MRGPPNRTRCFAAAAAGIFVFGIVLALLGTLFGLPEMRARLQVNLAQQGDLLLLLFAGVFFATVIVGPMLDRFGDQPVLAVSSLLVAVALAGFAAAHSFLAAAFSALVLGFGGGGLNTATNVLVSSLYGEERGPRLNILGIFFGFGALFIPLLSATISELFTPVELLLAAAFLAATCAGAYILQRFPPAHEAQNFSWQEAAEVIRYPGLPLFALLLLFQSGNEASIGGWVSTYVALRGSEARAATGVLAGYWAALMLGRLLSARLLRVMTKAKLVLISGLGSVAGCALLLAAPFLAALAAAAALTGLSFAGIYPTVLAMVGDRYQRFVGTVFGVLFSIALIGGMVFPWGIGHLSQAYGLRAGMLLPLLSATMICVLTALIMARDAKQGVSSKS